MKNQRIVSGRLQALNRERSSPSGNPRFTMMIQTPDGDLAQATTRPDSSLAYGLSNHVGKIVKVTCTASRGRLAVDDVEEVES